MTFKAIVLDKNESGQVAALQDFHENDLMAGDTTVRLTYSSLNYKDCLALTGKAPVVRRFPMIPGIDFAGVVETSSHPDFKSGDPVILNGWGVGESHFGAFAERARVRGDWLIPLPSGLTAQEAMAIGTAGYTAMLCVMALERAGLSPDGGPAVVTGAAGGVGSFAISLLAERGWHVIASTGRMAEAGYLKSLGAAEVVDRSELSAPGRPLGKERWIAGIDSVGSTTLANLLSMTSYGGAVAACGLAGGMDLPGSVAPFILRNVSLLGIDSVIAPKALRLEAWARLAQSLDREKLLSIYRTIPIGDVIEESHRLLRGQIRGRIVIDLGR